MTAITNNRDNTRTQSFTYDALNRIASAQTQTAGVTIPNPNCWGLTFGYDAWGNLLSSFTTGPAGCSEPLPLNVSATTSNQISAYCYDAAGNMLDPAACPTAPNPHAYAYNTEGQMTSAAGVTYTYDGDGKRVQKSNGKLYWYGMGSDPLDETDFAGNTSNASFSEYIFFGGKRIARRDSSNNVSYYFADHLGTARVSTNSSGTICYDADFYPFGGERIITDSCDSAYKFTGKERDSESGLDDFGARYMGSNMGRFMSPDPYNFGAALGAPQSWNAYSYVLNNPLSAIDPDGLDCIYLNDDTHDFEELKRGDCYGSTDKGYYVDGTISSFGITPDGNKLVYSYKNYPEDDPLQQTQYGSQCIGTCPPETVTVPGSADSNALTWNATPGLPERQYFIGPDPDWNHSRQAVCVGEGIEAAASDALGLDVLDAVSKAIVQGSAKPLKDLFTASGAATVAEKGAGYIAEHDAAQRAIRGALRSEGVRVSARTIGKRAGLLGKVFKWAVPVFAGISGHDAYGACMAY